MWELTLRRLVLLELFVWLLLILVPIGSNFDIWYSLE